ncbi:LOW QUALITY PROTEIN: hypothetical protein YC2023_094610 [Brassica napus]
MAPRDETFGTGDILGYISSASTSVPEAQSRIAPLPRTLYCSRRYIGSSASTSVLKAQSQTAPPPPLIAPGDISGYSSSASTSVPETQSQTSPPPPPPLIAPAAPLVPPAVPHIASGLHPDLMVPSKAPYAQQTVVDLHPTRTRRFMCIGSRSTAKHSGTF